MVCLSLAFMAGFVFAFFSSPAQSTSIIVSCFLGTALTGPLAAILFDRKRTWPEYAMPPGALRERILNLGTSAKEKPKEILTAPRSEFAFDPCCLEEAVIVLPADLVDRLPESEVQAIAAHKLQHPNDSKNSSFGCLLVAAIILTFIVAMARGGKPPYQLTIPLVTIVMCWRYLKARGKTEFEADQRTVKAAGNPEAVIASLRSLTREGYLPPDNAAWWQREIGVPTTSERIARIAADNGISQETLDRLRAAEPLISARWSAGSTCT
jgi:Zn-dependent protease with chaperone function